MLVSLASALPIIRLHSNNVIRRLSSNLEPIAAVHCNVRDLVSNGQFNQTLKLYKDQLHTSLSLHGHPTILPSVIKACSLAKTQQSFGLQLHNVAIKSGSDSDPVVSNSLISMYGKFSCTGLACQLFDEMPHRDLFSWNVVINCCVQNGCRILALVMVKDMLKCDYVPKPELIAGVLSLCAHAGDYRTARVIHALVIVDERIGESVFLSTALVDLYLKSRDLIAAFSVFSSMEVKNVVSWTAMIAGYNANQSCEMALDCFRKMQSEGLMLNEVSLLSVLPACGINHGREVHGYAIRHQLDSDHHLAAALIHMYCKYPEALQCTMAIFEKSTVKDVVLWSTVIGRFAQNGDINEAMMLLSKMRAEDNQPNAVTFLAIITVCTSQTSFRHGSGVHACILKYGLNSETFIGNALIDMYAKCGFLMNSRQVFEELQHKDFVSWSSLVHAYGLHGHGEGALEIFNEMQEKGVVPDGVAYLVVLSACDHAGLVEEGIKIFHRMKDVNKILLTLEHYACIINLLGRSGRISDACELLHSMPMKPSAKILSSLVSACKVHGRMEDAKTLASKLMDLEPGNAANLTLLSTVYAEAGNWPSVEAMWNAMKVQGLKKSCASSQIMVENKAL